MKKYTRAKNLAESLGVAQSTVWRWVKESRLPPPIRLANRTTVWDVEEVEAAIERIITEGSQK